MHPFDTARLHVAAATDLSMDRQRILALAEPWCWQNVLDIARKHRPNVPLPEFQDSKDRDLSTIETGLAKEILESHYGQDSFLSLYQGVTDLFDSIHEQ